jgi:hypothetical protein
LKKLKFIFSCHSSFLVMNKLARVNVDKNESTSVEEKRSSGGLVWDNGRETTMRSREGAMRGRGETLIDQEGGDGRRR